MLKILLDARKLGDGGIGTYLHNLISGLLQDPEGSLSLLVAQGKVAAYFTEDQLIQLEERSKPYSIDEMFFLGSRISASNRGQFDIFHEPHFTLPSGLNMPAVVTIHDLIQITNPEHWYYPAMARFLVKRALVGARRIIAVSEATKNSILDNFPRVDDLDRKITVIPNAVASRFLQEPEDWQELLKARFNLKPGYLFALFSMLKPHKGFSDLIEAYSRGHKRVQIPPLVVAGRGLVGITSDNSALLERLKSSNVQTLGEVSEKELAALYKGARATIVPSLVEGFGLTALEAKVLGSRLIVRPLPSLGSVTDSGDIVCSDMSLAALSEALCSVEKKLPEWQPRSRNEDLADRFSIKSVASRTMEVYREVLFGS